MAIPQFAIIRLRKKHSAQTKFEPVIAGADQIIDHQWNGDRLNSINQFHAEPEINIFGNHTVIIHGVKDGVTGKLDVHGVHCS